MSSRTQETAASLTGSDALAAGRYRTEANVKLDLSLLLDVMGYGPIENEHTIRRGSIDVYIPHHR